jgi:hypothetical protein
LWRSSIGGYEDFVDRRISEEFWARKSQTWEAELQAIDAERVRVEAPRPPMMVTAQKILELAEQAEFLYKSQDPAEQRRLLETVLSNCTFDRGTLCPTTLTLRRSTSSSVPMKLEIGPSGWTRTSNPPVNSVMQVFGLAGSSCR